MTVDAWRWLPDSSLTSSLLFERLDTALAAWSSRWFRDFTLSRRRVEFDMPISEVEMTASTPRLALQLSGLAPMTLVSAVMNEDVARLDLSEVEWTVLDGLRSQLMNDLAQTLDSALGDIPKSLAQGIDGSGPVSVQLADPAGRLMVTLSTTRAVMARARLESLPSVRPRSEPLQSLTSAIAQAQVHLNVRLGTTVIPLAEARHLAEGDVLVFDRKLDQGLDLIADSNGPVVTLGHLVDSSSPPSLRLAAARQ